MTRAVHTTTTPQLVQASGRSRQSLPEQLPWCPIAEVLRCNEWTVLAHACHLPPPACTCPSATVLVDLWTLPVECCLPAPGVVS